MGLIEHIRNKPHETRIRIIWISAGVAAVLLIAAWVLVGQMKLNPDKSFIGAVAERIGSPGKTFPKLFNKE